MSSSKQQQQQQPARNINDKDYQNQFLDYENDESLNLQEPYDDPTQSFENDLFEEDIDEDLPNEIIQELDSKARIQSNVNEEDNSVFSDVVQDAFRKYQDEQEELYAQMEECWNYMAEENKHTDTPKNTIEQSKLNPDANEFKPSWLKPSSSTTINEESLVTLTSNNKNKIDEQGKKF